MVRWGPSRDVRPLFSAFLKSKGKQTFTIDVIVWRCSGVAPQRERVNTWVSLLGAEMTVNKVTWYVVGTSERLRAKQTATLNTVRCEIERFSSGKQ